MVDHVPGAELPTMVWSPAGKPALNLQRIKMSVAPYVGSFFQSPANLMFIADTNDLAGHIVQVILQEPESPGESMLFSLE